MAPSQKSNKAYFIAGIGTDIGKSFLMENLCRILRKKNIAVNAIKPIASGFLDTHFPITPHSPPCYPREAGIQESSSQKRSLIRRVFLDHRFAKMTVSKAKENNCTSDPARILLALNQELTLENLNKITPWRFKEAISPHLAAKINNHEINFSEVVNFCKKNISQSQALNQTLFIESAGGIMTPINDNKTFLDLAFELEIPVLLLSANYLGSISHTLCSIEVLKNRQIFVEKIIVNDVLFQPHATKTSEIINTIESLSKTTTISFNDFLNLINEQHYY